MIICETQNKHIIILCIVLSKKYVFRYYFYNNYYEPYIHMFDKYLKKVRNFVNLKCKIYLSLLLEFRTNSPFKLILTDTEKESDIYLMDM